MNTILRTFYLLSLLALASLCHAESSSKQVRFLGWPASVEGLYCEVNGEMLSISIRKSRPSKYSTLQAGNDLVLYKEVEIPEENKSTYAPVAQFPYNKLSSSSLVLVLPTENDGYRLFPLNDNLEDCPVSSLTVCNLAPYRLATLIDGKVQQIGPLESIVFKNRPENAHSRLQVAGYRDDNEKVKFNTSVLLRAGFRYFMFIQDTSITKVEGRNEDLGLEFFYVSDYL